MRLRSIFSKISELRQIEGKKDVECYNLFVLWGTYISWVMSDQIIKLIVIIKFIMSVAPVLGLMRLVLINVFRNPGNPSSFLTSVKFSKFSAPCITFTLESLSVQEAGVVL